jgi:hypothetical protein
MDSAFQGAPDELKALFAELKDTIRDAVDAAPSEIKDEVEQTADAIGDLDKALADADYDLLDLDMAILTDLGEGLDAASEKIETYNEEECGIVPGTTGDDGAEETGDTLGDTGSAREQMVKLFESMGLTNDEATCIAENIDPAMAEQAGTDPSVLFDVFETCDVSLERLAEIGANSGG